MLRKKTRMLRSGKSKDNGKWSSSKAQPSGARYDKIEKPDSSIEKIDIDHTIHELQMNDEGNSICSGMASSSKEDNLKKNTKAIGDRSDVENEKKAPSRSVNNDIRSEFDQSLAQNHPKMDQAKTKKKSTKSSKSPSRKETEDKSHKLLGSNSLMDRDEEEPFNDNDGKTEQYPYDFTIPGSMMYQVPAAICCLICTAWCI